MPWDQSSEDETVLLFGEILNPLLSTPMSKLPQAGHSRIACLSVLTLPHLGHVSGPPWSFLRTAPCHAILRPVQMVRRLACRCSSRWWVVQSNPKRLPPEAICSHRVSWRARSISCRICLTEAWSPQLMGINVFPKVLPVPNFSAAFLR